jgi:hypothetical protein
MKAVSRQVTVALALTIGAFLLAGIPCLAQGVGVSPAIIEVQDALRGSESLRTLKLVNNEEKDLRFDLVAQGDVGGWVTVSEMDEPDTPLTSVVVPYRSSKQLRFKIAVPQDAANGPHEGLIRFQTALTNPMAANADSRASIGIVATLKITVTGIANLSGRVQDARVFDVEVDQPPTRLVTVFQNMGNVQASPEVKVTIKNEKGAVVGETKGGMANVDLRQIVEIVSEWDHSGQPVGKYTAQVATLLDGKAIDEREASFQILKAGTITRRGVLQNLKIVGEPQLGGQAKLVATFQNTGRISSKAVLAAEVQHNGALLRALESRERSFDPLEVGEIELYFDTARAGDYGVKAMVHYGGKVTDAKEVAFTVAGGPASATTVADASAPQTSILLYLLGAGAVCAVGLFGITAWRRRPLPPRRQQTASARAHSRDAW